MEVELIIFAEVRQNVVVLEEYFLVHCFPDFVLVGKDRDPEKLCMFYFHF